MSWMEAALGGENGGTLGELQFPFIDFIKLPRGPMIV